MSKGIIKKDRFVFLLSLIIIYELIVSATRNLFVVPMIFVDVIPWPLVLAVFFDFSKENAMPAITGNLSIIGMTLICLFSVPNILEHYTSGNGGAIFATYYCFAFLPMLYLYCPKRISVIFSGIVAIFMLLSLKRAAFIIVVMGISLYYILKNYVENESRRKIQRLIGIMLILIALGFAGQFIIERLNLDIISRLSNILEDGGSGRTRIWDQVLWYFNTSSLGEKLFGHGFHAVFYNIRPLGIARYAHNSLLETMYDYGVIGLVMILFVVFKIMFESFSMVKKRHRMAPVMCYTLIPMLLLSFVSYFFEQSIIIIPHVIIWGICMGNYHRDRRNMSRNLL